jgi:hypothetical protein
MWIKLLEAIVDRFIASHILHPASVMQLTFFRLAPLLGLHALICLLHLNRRPTLLNWQRQITPPPIAMNQLPWVDR